MTDKKILVIDDDPDILDSLKTILKANGFNTLTAQGGQEGIDVFNKEKPYIRVNRVCLILIMKDTD